ncbi:DNA adenine methylase [Anaerocolumna sp. AGMB13020]|uniref:DNA adenine methylase n=1 Tax=Anaerocolumna sp. AGMB13020 TaxID=3081750 RepID=UPI0029544540|nr:DNA adenine methylase [Anaerocolumna sp. AGMB13020]WOO34935.1 DNA adenine methylase [Anaerocolumna sp. AGMB13020]
MNSFISWIGGKRLLRNKILEQFPGTEEYDRYIEVFGGAGWVLFSKERHADLEVFNDANGDLINLYRIVKFHSEALQKELDWNFVSREQFFDYKEQINNRGQTDIQRAAKFFMLIKNSFGSDLRSFGVRNRNLDKAIDYLQEVKDRLRHTVIENKDFEGLLKTYDRERALFYLDPPYYDAEEHYDIIFKEADHIRLKESLDKLKGKFILSYNDSDYIRKLYKDYKVIEVDRQNNLVCKGSSERYKELIIKNF